MVIINDNRELADEFTQDIYNIEREIQYSLNNMQDNYSAYQRVIKDDQWQALLHKWSSLKASWKDLDFISNLFAHNEIINEIINIIQKLADSERVRLGKENRQLLLHWPKMLEHLGILRALGVYALSSQSSNTLMNISLTMSEHKTRAMQILSHESSKANNQPLFHNTESVLRQIDDMLVNGDLNNSVKSFYNDMTLLIDDWFASLHQNLESTDLVQQHKINHR